MSASGEPAPDPFAGVTVNVLRDDAPASFSFQPGKLSFDLPNSRCHVTLGWKRYRASSVTDRLGNATWRKVGENCYGLDLRFPIESPPGSLSLESGWLCASSEERAPPIFDRLRVRIKPPYLPLRPAPSGYASIVASQPSEVVQYEPPKRFGTIQHDDTEYDPEEAERRRLEYERAEAESFSKYALPGAILRSIFPPADSATPAGRPSIDEFALLSYGIHAKHLQVESSETGRVLIFTRFPDLGGRIEGGAGSVGVVLMHQAEHPSEASKVVITSTTGHIAISSWPPPLPATREKPHRFLAFQGMFQSRSNSSQGCFSAVGRSGIRYNDRALMSQLLSEQT